MMWRNGRFLPYNGDAALFWPATGGRGIPHLPRRQHARRGRTARRLRKRGQPGCVTAGSAWRRVRGNGAAAAARAVRPHAKAAGLGRRPQRRDSPAAPAACGGNPSPVQRSPWVDPAPMLGARPGPDGPARRRRAIYSCIDIAHRFSGHPLGVMCAEATTGSGHP